VASLAIRAGDLVNCRVCSLDYGPRVSLYERMFSERKPLGLLEARNECMQGGRSIPFLGKKYCGYDCGYTTFSRDIATRRINSLCALCDAIPGNQIYPLLRLTVSELQVDRGNIWGKDWTGPGLDEALLAFFFR
jgi:hypothetical protein